MAGGSSAGVTERGVATTESGSLFGAICPPATTSAVFGGSAEGTRQKFWWYRQRMGTEADVTVSSRSELAYLALGFSLQLLCQTHIMLLCQMLNLWMLERKRDIFRRLQQPSGFKVNVSSFLLLTSHASLSRSLASSCHSPPIQTSRATLLTCPPFFAELVCHVSIYFS